MNQTPFKDCHDDIRSVFQKSPLLKDISTKDIYVMNCGNYQVEEKKVEYTRYNGLFKLFIFDKAASIKLTDFSEKLHLKDWIKEGNFEVIFAIRGKIPIEFVSNKCLVLRFSDNFPPETVALYLRISKEVSNADFFQLIKEAQNTDIQVLEAVLSIEVGEK